MSFLPTAIPKGDGLPQILSVPPALEKRFHRLRERLSKRQGPALARLKAIYGWVDAYIAACVTPIAVCRPGCAHCCRLDVSVTLVEAMAIASHLGQTAGLKQAPDLGAGRHTPCPLLGADQRCSVYGVRPFNCRTFHAADSPDLCWPPNQPHLIFGASGQGYGSDPLLALALEVHKLAREAQTAGLPSEADIRQWAWPTNPATAGRKP